MTVFQRWLPGCWFNLAQCLMLVGVKGSGKAKIRVNENEARKHICAQNEIEFLSLNQYPQCRYLNCKANQLETTFFDSGDPSTAACLSTVQLSVWCKISQYFLKVNKYHSLHENIEFDQHWLGE